MFHPKETMMKCQTDPSNGNRQRCRPTSFLLFLGGFLRRLHAGETKENSVGQMVLDSMSINIGRNDFTVRFHATGEGALERALPSRRKRKRRRREIEREREIRAGNIPPIAYRGYRFVLIERYRRQTCTLSTPTTCSARPGVGGSGAGAATTAGWLNEIVQKGRKREKYTFECWMVLPKMFSANRAGQKKRSSCAK